MTTPTAGAIGMAQVRVERGTAGTISLNESAVRSLAGVPSGTISLSNLYNKTGVGSSPPLAVTAFDGIAAGDAPPAVFTATVNPRVTVTGGTTPYSYQWTISIQSDSGFTLASPTAAICSVSHQIGRYGYVGECTLTCVVSDASGKQLEKTGIVASFDFQQKSTIER